jgi:BTB/POZ domain
MRSTFPSSGGKLKRTNPFFSVGTHADGFHDENLPLPLSWRDDPSISLSDWTIVASFSCFSDENTSNETDSCDNNVVDDDDNRKSKLNNEADIEQNPPRTYHVHRTVLGAGARQCQYFSSLFQQVSCLEHATNTSQLQFCSLEELDGFEIFLDFLYNGVYLEAGQNAVVSRHLALYFQCQAFMSQVNQFIARDLTPDRAALYLIESTKYGDERLIQSATQLCAHYFVDVTDLNSLSTSMFLSILKSPQLKCCSRVLSLKVNSYLCSLAKEDVTAQLLHEFTRVEIMPELDSVAARGILRVLKQVDTSEQKAWSSLQNLARRCADAISMEGWTSIQVDKLIEDLGHKWDDDGSWHQKSDFASLVLSSALSRAQEVCTMQGWELENLRNELAMLRRHSNYDSVQDITNRSVVHLFSDVLNALDETTRDNHDVDIHDDDNESDRFSSLMGDYSNDSINSHNNNMNLNAPWTSNCSRRRRPTGFHRNRSFTSRNTLTDT